MRWSSRPRPRRICVRRRTLMPPEPSEDSGQNHRAALGDTGRYSLQPGPHSLRLRPRLREPSEQRRFLARGSGIDYTAFYSYAYPVPERFGRYTTTPQAAFFHEGLGEFLLPYDAVRTAPDPDAALLSFLESTYEAAANLAHWDRAALECLLGVPGVPRATKLAQPRGRRLPARLTVALRVV
jgi:Family of unknown function (DUF5996)